MNYKYANTAEVACNLLFTTYYYYLLPRAYLRGGVQGVQPPPPPRNFQIFFGKVKEKR